MGRSFASSVAISNPIHTTPSIAHIAMDNGFYDHSAFVKRFKKFTGTTPMNYRTEQQSRDTFRGAATGL